ncbi:Response regulator receiver and ANTAR domain protein [Mycolicibacterium flavescens]|uniref:GAF and ANTAR domain-containing protein n=1 Tax=Mycobacterium neumannii TaxID=2048551 RepID=UPI000B945F0D|nr:GAF and ANTAR domain-containing protein [Mycobacterium neumannii]VEG39120.1 Response regulator receiver and ANTAR domain protein [Mycolicibacterium flavescens]
MTDLRGGALHEEIARLARSLHSQKSADMDVDNLVDEVTATAVRILPNVHHAGISLVEPKSRRVRSVAATGPVPKDLDTLQEELQQGPCVDAVHEHMTVRIKDFQTEDRWVEFIGRALEATPVRSSLSIQLYTHDSEIGALNLYSERARTFTPHLEDLALAVAAHAAIGLATARRDDQFQTALASRDIIGQAKGMIMERFAVDAPAAFNLLVKLSQEKNTPLQLIAVRLVDTVHRPT